MRVHAESAARTMDLSPRRWTRRMGALSIGLAFAAVVGTGCFESSSEPLPAVTPHPRRFRPPPSPPSPQAESPTPLGAADPPQAEPRTPVATGGDRSGDRQAELSVRVVSDRHEIDFPEAIRLRLEIEADDEIAEVTLFYHLAGNPSRVYGYPQVMVGRSVSTEFSIQTDGASYLPSGVEIEYYYVIRGAGGGVVETPHVKVAYLDPVYRWRELRQGDLVVTWHDISEERVRTVVSNVEPRMRAAKEMFGLEDARPIKAVIFNSRREADRGLPFVSQAASRTHLFGGFAFQEYDLFVLSGLYERGIAHEATHLLMGQAVTSPLAKVPAWLNEGLATYFEGSDAGRGRTVAAAASRRDLLRPPVDGVRARPARGRGGVLRSVVERRDAHDRDPWRRAHVCVARSARLRTGDRRGAAAGLRHGRRRPGVGVAGPARGIVQTSAHCRPGHRRDVSVDHGRGRRRGRRIGLPLAGARAPEPEDEEPFDAA